MAKRRAIVIGDKTTHGGVVLQGSFSMTVEGKAVALQGDLVACPQCKGNFPIIEGAVNMSSNGRGVALEGMKTACGAELIGSQNLMWADDGKSYTTDTIIDNSEDEDSEEENYGIQYYLTDDYDRPYANLPFSIKFSDHEEQGYTDENGYTPFYNLANEEDVEIKLHANPQQANSWRWENDQ